MSRRSPSRAPSGAAAAAPLGLALGVALAARGASAGAPMRPDAWWTGLDVQPGAAAGRGVVALRAPSARWVRIPGGSFLMGSSATDMIRAVTLCRREMYGALCRGDVGMPGIRFRAELPAHQAFVSPFELERTEVSVEAYGRCVAAGACAEPAFVRGDARFDRPDFPVTEVRWDDAAAYCAWSGGRLPTEAEWELAARGPSGRDFPWGNVYNGHVTNHGALASDETDASDGYAGLAPVDAFPDGATPEGVLNLAGNASEWVDDLYDTDENGFGYSPLPQTNPRGTRGVFHVVRGGSFTDGAAWQRAAWRGEGIIARSASVGFRCARTPGERGQP